nr:hypothetical protein RKHAN_01868 [Rhizobium sp. Khangiran2]
MEELLAQRAALVAARSNGQLETEFPSGGTRRRVTYRSIAELERAIAAIDRDIAALEGKRVTTFLPIFTSGF